MENIFKKYTLNFPSFLSLFQTLRMMLYGGQDGQTTCTVAKVRTQISVCIYCVDNTSKYMHGCNLLRGGVILHFTWTLSSGRMCILKHPDYLQKLFNLIALEAVPTSTESRRVGQTPKDYSQPDSQKKSIQPSTTALFTLAFKMCSLVICSHPYFLCLSVIFHWLLLSLQVHRWLLRMWPSPLSSQDLSQVMAYLVPFLILYKHRVKAKCVSMDISFPFCQRFSSLYW